MTHLFQLEMSRGLKKHGGFRRRAYRSLQGIDKISFFAIALNNSFELLCINSLEDIPGIASVQKDPLDGLCADPASKILMFLMAVAAQFAHIPKHEPPWPIREAAAKTFNGRAHR